MPKLSEIAGVAPAATAPASSKMRLSDVMAAHAAPSFEAQNLPTIAGPLGFSKEFQGATGAGHMSAFKPALADMFGSYEDVANALQKVAPGAKVVRDAKGFEVLELPDGKRFAMNKPGVQGHEVAAGVGNVLAYLPAGKLAGLGGNIMARAGIGGVASAATDAGLQKIAGREEIDPVRMALSAAGGSLGELVAPAVGNLTNRAYKALKAKFGSHAKAVAAGRAIAQQAGIDKPSDKLSLEMLKRWDEIKGGAKPGTLIAESEIGLKLTKGQKTGNFGQLRREEMLRNSDSMAGSFIRDTDAANQSAIVDYFAKIRNDMAGGEAAGTVGDAFDRVSQSVRNEFGNAERITDELYGKVSKSGAMVDADAVREIPKVMKKAVTEFPITHDLTRGANSLIETVKKDIASLPDEASAVSLRAIETQRQRINNAIGSADNPTDRRALMALKSAFDGWYSALDGAVVRGNPKAIDMMKTARAARASQGARFEGRNPGDGGDIIERMLEGRASPQELAEAAFGQSQTGKANSVQFIRAAKKALQPEIGPMNPAFGELKAAYLQRMTVGKNGEPLGPQAIMNNLKTALTTRKDVLRELYTPDEISRLSRAAQTLDAIVPKGMLGRSSGTSERAFSFLEQLMGGIPFAGNMLKMMQGPSNAVTARTMYAPLRPRNLGDDLSVAVGATTLPQARR